MSATQASETAKATKPAKAAQPAPAPAKATAAKPAKAAAPAPATTAPKATTVVVKAKTTSTTTTPAKTKPGPSEVEVNTPRLIKSIGMMILGGGIIAGTIWYFGADLIMMALYIALPVLFLFVALRLISSGTVQLIFNGELKDKVDDYMKSLETPPKKASA